MLKDGFKLGTQTGHPAGEAGTHQSTWEVAAAAWAPALQVGRQETPGFADSGSCKSPPAPHFCLLQVRDAPQGHPEEQGEGCQPVGDAKPI